jgi:stalled ribosome alternative rescue factor ArfA
MKLTKLFESNKPQPVKQNPVAKAMVQDPQFKSKVIADKKKQSKAGYLKHKSKVEEGSFGDAEEMANNWNKYGLTAKHVNGKFYSYQHGKQTGVFDTMDLLRGHQEELIADAPTKESVDTEFTDKQIKMAFGIINDPRYKAGNYSGAVDTIEKLAKGLSNHPSVQKALMRANESIGEGFDVDNVMAILKKYPNEFAKLKVSGDVMEIYDTPLYQALFDYYQDEMPYGTQKARDGDPVEWLNDRLDDLNIFESTQKPYVSMYREVDPLTQKNKMVYDVLNNQGKSVHKTHDEAEAMKWFKNNYDRLKMEASGYEGQSEPTHHIFKDADIKKIADIIKQKDLKAYPEQTTDGVKIHTYNTDRKSVASALEINEDTETDYEGSMDYELSGDDGELAYGTIYYKAINGVVDPTSLDGSYEYNGNHKIDDTIADEMIKPGGEEHEEALKAAQEDYDYEVGRMKSKFEQQSEPELTADDHDDDVPAFLKKYHDKEKELNHMRKLAGMSTASTNENYAKMTQDLIVKLVKQGKSNDEIQQATGEAGIRIDAIRNSVEQEQPKEATNDLAKSLNPLKGAVGSKQSTQMTAKGFDTIAKGERPTPQQTKAMEPYMSKIAKAITDPSTQAQMRNVIKKV